MRVSINKPSCMDAVTVDSKNPDTIVTVKPRRFAKHQRKIMVFPFMVADDASDGKLVDQGYIVFDVKTGKLAIEHRLEEVPI